MRWLCVVIKDWDFACLEVDVPLSMPAVVAQSNRVLQANHSAKNYGVHVGMRLKKAYEACPELVEMGVDESRSGRGFETIISVVSNLVADLETVRPGVIIAPARPPVKWAGDEQSLQKMLIESVVEATGLEVEVGIADGVGAALWAAQCSQIVPEGASREFLSNVSLRDLESLNILDFPLSGVAEFIWKLQALGISSCGQLADIPKESIFARFGDLGMSLWRLARGEDVSVSVKPKEKSSICVSQDCDPILENVQTAVFVAKSMSEHLIDRLNLKGFSARGIRIKATSESGIELVRTWLILGDKSAKAISERVRWQLQGWLQGGQLRGGISKLSLEAVDTYPAGEGAESLWGKNKSKDNAVSRLIARLETRLGDGTVKQLRYCGGFDPRTAIDVVSYPVQLEKSEVSAGSWSGSLLESGSWPEVVLQDPIPILLLDEGGLPIKVDAAGDLSGFPNSIKQQESGTLLDSIKSCANEVVSVSPLWQVWGRWWCDDSKNNFASRAYLMVTVSAGYSLLLCYRRGDWTVEGIYP